MNCVLCGRQIEQMRCWAFERDQQIRLLLLAVARRKGRFRASEVEEEVARLGYTAAEVDAAFYKLLMAGWFVEVVA